MGLTLNVTRYDVEGRRRIREVDVTWDSAYVRGGEALTPADLGLAVIESIVPVTPNPDVVVAYDATNSKLKAFRRNSPVGVTRTIDDDDDAASEGVAIYVHAPTQTADMGREVGTANAVLGWLEFVSPTNANGSFTLSNGDIVDVFDDDNASSGGVQVYCDEDEAVVSPLQANIATLLRDVVVRTRGGDYILISHDASAASNGVAVYFDEDGVEPNRVKFVSPTNADAVVTIDPEVSAAADFTGTTHKLIVKGY